MVVDSARIPVIERIAENGIRSVMLLERARGYRRMRRYKTGQAVPIEAITGALCSFSVRVLGNTVESPASRDSTDAMGQ